MRLLKEQIQTSTSAKSCMTRLEQLFREMDHAYDTAARHYGFNCRGCEDNCCLTLFYHYTYLEYFYILDGYQCLGEDVRRDISEKAADALTQVHEAESAGRQVRVMCPLNTQGQCILYVRRPMICRFHGIAHELHRPDKSVLYGPGCDLFMKNYDPKRYFPFDRTPFYRKMAELEADFKRELGANQKIKMTVAQMINSF